MYKGSEKYRNYNVGSGFEIITQQDCIYKLFRNSNETFWAAGKATSHTEFYASNFVACFCVYEVPNDRPKAAWLHGVHFPDNRR